MSYRFAAFCPATLILLLTCAPARALDAVTDVEVAMRIGPGTQHRAAGTVPADSRVMIHGCIQADRWCLVRFAGRRGWVPGGILEHAGLSRPPAPEPVAAAAPSVILVPVPVPADDADRRALSAEDVIVGIDEQFGLAALAGHAGHKPIVRHKPRRSGLFFKSHGASRGFHSVRPKRFGHAPHVFLGHGSRSAKAFHFDRFHFRKRGFHLGEDGKHFGHGRHFDDGLHHGKLSKGRRFGGHTGKIRSFGFGIKGGWRP